VAPLPRRASLLPGERPIPPLVKEEAPPPPFRRSLRRGDDGMGGTFNQASGGLTLSSS